MFLLKYTAKNTEGYMLVYAKTFEQAEEKFKKRFWFYDNLHIVDCTMS